MTKLSNEILKEITDKAYKVFSKYRIDDFENVTFYDFSPSEEELKDISKPLRKIPDKAIESMEFFSEDFESWGTKLEVKFLIPRLLEYLTNHIEELEDPGFFSFFNYKLKDSLLDTSVVLNIEEKSIVRDYFLTLLTMHMNQRDDVCMLLECSLAIGITPAKIMEKWQPQEKQLIKQLIIAYKHFEINALALPITSKGLYYDGSNNLNELLNSIFGKISEKQFTEVGNLAYK